MAYGSLGHGICKLSSPKEDRWLGCWPRSSLGRRWRLLRRRTFSATERRRSSSICTMWPLRRLLEIRFLRKNGKKPASLAIKQKDLWLWTFTVRSLFLLVFSYCELRFLYHVCTPEDCQTYRVPRLAKQIHGNLDFAGQQLLIHFNPVVEVPYWITHIFSWNMLKASINCHGTAVS